jgi:hypothetical protein
MKEGGIRICVDFKKLNDVFLHDLFPTSFIDEVLENMGGHEAYLQMDSAYLQMDSQATIRSK